MTPLPDGRIAVAPGAIVTISVFAHNMPLNVAAFPSTVNWGSVQTSITSMQHGDVKIGIFTVPGSGLQGTLSLGFNFVPDDQGDFGQQNYTIEMAEQLSGFGQSTFDDPTPVTPPPVVMRGYVFVTV